MRYKRDLRLAERKQYRKLIRQAKRQLDCQDVSTNKVIHQIELNKKYERR